MNNLKKKEKFVPNKKKSNNKSLSDNSYKNKRNNKKNY